MDCINMHTIALCLVSLYWIHVHGDQCIPPGATYNTTWSYSDSRESDRYGTIWQFYNGSSWIDIMLKNSANVTTTPSPRFAGRISPHPDYNAGMILKNTTIADTGIYQVAVTFTVTPIRENDTEALEVSNTKCGPHTLNYHVSVDGDELTQTPYDIKGLKGATFTFTLIDAIADISITKKDKVVLQYCENSTSCSTTVFAKYNVYVNVTVWPDMSNHSFPNETGWEFYKFAGLTNGEKAAIAVVCTVIPGGIITVLVLWKIGKLDECLDHKENQEDKEDVEESNPKEDNETPQPDYPL